MVFGGIWKECDQSGPSIRLIGGKCACLLYLQLVFWPHLHVSRQKNPPKTGFSHGRGSTLALDWGKASLSLECYLCMEQICSFQRLAIIFKSNISGRTINGVFQQSLCIPPILKLYDFCGTKIQLATMVFIIACPALWECFLSVAAFLLLLSLLFSPPAPETAAWLTHHRPRH